MYKYQKGFAPIVIALIVIALVGVGGGSYYLINKASKQMVCTTDAKVCPDGSSVGRTGPGCEFAACPEVKVDETTVKALSFNKSSFDLTNKTFAIEVSEGKTTGKTKVFKVNTTDKTKIYSYSNDGKINYETFSEFANSIINYKNDAFDIGDSNLVYIYGGYTIKGVLLGDNVIEASEISPAVNNQ